ncbi:nucleotidyltransferase family protein [Aliiroseovarius sp. KMU-50]|uniref:Nucleotidyltransferase family protein n=1 Tax=Aliiroseovarius salicola TaxID=3009082 RepID=A0ABT4W335_9RHOB|nr:nucleotidyltransferase family protein [Aliiroseovarius sp. KMU-50]MDA5094916.1 nucleotidyltransferase family protein [Aliiroseovarius sp. KMU-50]
MKGSPHLCILLLAAGQSKRMGGADKLMLSIGGQPLLADRIETALATGLDLTVVLPQKKNAPHRWALIPNGNLNALPCLTAYLGMGEALATGFKSIGNSYDGVLVLLADMPDLTTLDIQEVARNYQHGSVVRGASQDGSPGHPVLIPKRLFNGMTALRGDQGAKDLLLREDIIKVPLPEHHALTDLDTPTDWANYKKRFK